MTMITPSYLGETIEYSSLHACRSTLEDPTFDLAHVDPSGEGFDALGKGVAEGKPSPDARYVSKGLTRSRTDRLKVMAGGADAVSSHAAEGQSGGAASNVTALAPRTEVSGSTALKAAPEPRLSPAQALEQETRADTRAHAKAVAAERRAEAKAKGYEGEACGTCGNFTLVRNGTCLKCDTCGSTTGCS